MAGPEVGALRLPALGAQRAAAPLLPPSSMAQLYEKAFAQFVVRRPRFCPPCPRLQSVTAPRGVARRPPATGSAARPFKCAVPGCTSLFGKANHLSRHVRIVHNKERPFRCTADKNCDSRFGSRSHLVDHVNAVHRRLRNFKCEQCNAAFSKAFNLAKHVRIMHLKEKNFKCDHCELTFGTRSHATRHAAKMHPLPTPPGPTAPVPVAPAYERAESA